MTADDDATVGKSVAYWVNGTAGYHAMTVVGYNDQIWTDINGNGVVDNGEKGAFRIANSWGTGCKEGGFCWMAYDALKGSSAVSGAPSAGRIDGTFVFDFTDLATTANGQRWHLGLYDSTTGDPVDLYSYTLIDVANGEFPVDSVNVPQTGDAGQLYTAIDYNADSANQASTANVSAVPVSGDAPLPVSFDASGSSDADGSIGTYHWNFGDGSFGIGNNVNHTYQAGQFTAVLTVTDNDGATDTDAVVITVEDPSALNAPSSLRAAFSGRTVTLSWSHSGDNEDGFTIERAVKVRGKYNFSPVGSVGANVTSYVKTVAKGTYKYRVQAYQGNTQSGYSNEVSVRVK